MNPIQPIITTRQKGTAHSAFLFSSLTVFTETPPPNQPSIQGRPPQINWASRPTPRTDNPGVTLASSPQHAESVIEATGSGRRLVAVYVDANRLAELEEVLCQLELPLLLAPCPNDEHCGHPERAPQNNEERKDGDRSAELDQLTASLSSLSTSEEWDMKASDLFPPRTVYPDNSSMVSPGKKRYYTITVGKCTGVYWDTW
jgi:hypothetical protein